MKVTVCFGDVRVVVPCGTGGLLVRELIHESIRRFKKASGKDSDTCVVVHHLHSQSGILDPDDRVSDVADDRETLVATFDDGHGPEPNVPQGGGDGASGSSVGTISPDIFRLPPDSKYTTNVPHIEVTGINDQQSSSGLGLQVRRGSEPSLNQIGVDHQPYTSPTQNSDHTKRWSAAPVCRSDTEPPERILNGNGYLSTSWRLEESELEDSQHDNSHNNNFSRSGRLSMQFLGDGAGYKWIDAAERVSNTPVVPQYSSKSLPRELKRKEPLGQAYESMREKNEEMLLIMNEEKGPLGLTAIPDMDNGGLLVQAVEPGSRAERGYLRRGDRILEINGTKLIGLPEGSVQAHLRKSLADPELRLRVLRADKHRRGTKIAEMIEATDEKPTANHNNVATVSPTRKIVGGTAGATSLQVANTRKLGRRIEITLKKGPLGLGFSVTTRDNPAGGDCPIYIKNILPRGAAIEDGRLRPGDRLLEVDSIPMTGKTQTEVVGILRATQPGATVKIVVSRQQELAEIDEREIGFGMNGEHDSAPPKPPPPVLPQKPVKPQKQNRNDSTISIKHTNENSILNNSSSFIDTNGNATTGSISSSDSNAVFPWRNREILTLHIPVHDTEKAGLGVSVKGKTGSTNTSNGNIAATTTKHDGDLGIFIKSVINGGAASRDGRLKMNDQLLSVNGISLLGQSNADAMETLRRAMLKTAGKYPGMITLMIARRISSRSNSSAEQIDTDTSTSISEKSGATIIYLASDNNNGASPGAPDSKGLVNNLRNIHGGGDMNGKRWSNPVLDRLTGGTGNSPQNNWQSPLITHGLRNDSYYIATNDHWSPANQQQQTGVCHLPNNSVLIEEDPEPSSPALPLRPSMESSYTSTKPTSPSTPNTDGQYSSQQSLDTNPPHDAFSRDAIGRRSISEKHHAALDAKETGTYQRNKKLREEREREKRAMGVGSVESLTRMKQAHKTMNNHELYAEALDNVGELGPSLGLKKSSSLESLQTMVQEIQMSDEPRGPNALRTPRGRGREESLRAAVERPPENQPRKHWLLEEAPSDSEGGFVNRNSIFQSSLNDNKHKLRPKKPSLLRGIGHMFRFGKHRKDGIAPTETLSDFGAVVDSKKDSSKFQTLPPHAQQPSNSSLSGHNSQSRQMKIQAHLNSSMRHNDRKGSSGGGGSGGPPMYQPPPPPLAATSSVGIHKQDLFNHRYSHYVNYEELQQQISLSTSSTDQLNESMLDQMRQQVMHQRNKVEEESRRHQHYHSQRSSRNDGSHQHQRPVSSYYEYETVQHGNPHHQRKTSIPNSTSVQWNATASGRHRGPYVTQVTIRDQNQSGNSQPASQV